MRQKKRSNELRKRSKAQQKANVQLRLPPGAARYYRLFIEEANISALHPNDWILFYEFVCFCHRHQVTLDYWDLRQALVAERFSEETARNLSEAYRHGREILKIRRRVP